MQGLQVLEDVARLGRDQHDEQLLERLVDVAHAVRLHERVLLPEPDQLGERREQALHARPRHLDKLPCQQRCRGAREEKEDRVRSAQENGGKGMARAGSAAPFMQ